MNELAPADPIARFYQSVATRPADNGEWRIELDGRPIRTPAKAVLTAPPAVAVAIAAEWEAQERFVLPQTMPMTRLVNSAIDGVAGRLAEVAEDIVRIAGNDLLFYRADQPAGLVANQEAHWNPVIAETEAALSVRLVMAEGVMPVRQDPRLEDALRERLPRRPLPLTGVHQLSALMGSALLALAVFEGRHDLDRAWAAAHVDEDWNIMEWGEDAEAAARRAVRRREAEAAATLATLD